MENYSQLFQTVINESEANDWENAVNEWDITSEAEDDEANSQCICGKENIKYLFEITNKYNGKVLYPIGSSCINKFGRNELDEVVNITEQKFKLLHNIKDNKRIELSAEFFSRKLLKWLYDESAFVPNQHNKWDGRNDYEFMLKMFNKKNKESISLKQKRKIQKVLECSIIPFLKTKFINKAEED